MPCRKRTSVARARATARSGRGSGSSTATVARRRTAGSGVRPRPTEQRRGMGLAPCVARRDHTGTVSVLAAADTPRGGRHVPPGASGRAVAVVPPGTARLASVPVTVRPEAEERRGAPMNGSSVSTKNAPDLLEVIAGGALATVPPTEVTAPALRAGILATAPRAGTVTVRQARGTAPPGVPGAAGAVASARDEAVATVASEPVARAAGRNGDVRTPVPVAIADTAHPLRVTERTVLAVTTGPPHAGRATSVRRTGAHRAGTAARARRAEGSTTAIARGALPGGPALTGGLRTVGGGPVVTRSRRIALVTPSSRRRSRRATSIPPPATS